MSGTDMAKSDQRVKPDRRSLIDGQTQRSNCGVGFVARLDGVPLHEVAEHGVRVLVNLEHRCAVGGDKTTGDGAGLLLQVPDRFLRTAADTPGIILPPAGEYGVGMLFLPRDDAAAARCRALIERHAQAAGLALLGWRDVPVSADHLGEFSRATLPSIGQVFLGRGSVAPAALERKLYLVRRLAEKEAAENQCLQVLKKVIGKDMILDVSLKKHHLAVK